MSTTSDHQQHTAAQVYPVVAAATQAVDAVLTVDEVADLLRIGPKSVRRLVRLKRIPHRVIDRRGTLRFSRVAVEQWLAEGGR